MDDRRVAEGVEHLQTAAHELISAARVFLDAVEELVDEPEQMTNSVAGIVDLLKGAAGHRTHPWESHAWSDGTASQRGRASGSDNDGAPDESELSDDGDSPARAGDLAASADPVMEPATASSGPESATASSNPKVRQHATPGAPRRNAGAGGRSTVKRISVD